MRSALSTQWWSKVCLGWQIKGRRVPLLTNEAAARLDWPMRGWGLPWLTNERLRSALADKLEAEVSLGRPLKDCGLPWLMRGWGLPWLTNERLSSALADQWDVVACFGWPTKRRRLSLAGAEGSACEGKRFHGVPNLVEEFGHGGHAREMTPKKWHHSSFYSGIWKLQKTYLW